MADKNPLNDKINIELVKLQDELGALDAAVKHIEKAGQTSREVIDAIKKVQQRYDEALQRIESKYSDFLNQTSQQTEKEVQKLAESHNKQVDEVQKLLDNYLDLAEATAKLPDEINKIDFPVRLDRMEEAIQGLNDSLLRTQSNLDGLESRLGEKLDKYDALGNKINKNSSQINALKGLQTATLIAVAALLIFEILTQFGII